MKNRSSFYRTQDEEYQSLSRDAAELYLLRKNMAQTSTNSNRLLLFVLSSALIVFSFFLLLLF